VLPLSGLAVRGRICLSRIERKTFFVARDRLSFRTDCLIYVLSLPEWDIVGAGHLGGIAVVLAEDCAVESYAIKSAKIATVDPSRGVTALESLRPAVL
jgi:hypothetical protein